MASRPSLLLMAGLLVLLLACNTTPGAAENPAPEGLAVAAPCTGPGATPATPPAKGSSYRDPDYGGCITRLTDHASEPPTGFARNDYSRRQAFNADGSRVLIYAQDGGWHLYDPRNGSYLRRLPFRGADSEPQWDLRNPDRLYFLPNHGGMELDALQLDTGHDSVAADFRHLSEIAGHPTAHSLQDIWPAAAHVWTRAEGSPSRDMRYWAFQVEDRDFHSLGLISYDLQDNRIVGLYDLAKDGAGIGRPDHVSMSPEGNYVVASWNDGSDCPADTLGSLRKPCGLMAFNRNFTQATGLASRGPHSDIALAADGREVIVISNYVSGDVEMIDLEKGHVTPLWRIYLNGASTAMHFSGKAYRRPGWVLISTYGLRDPEDSRPWYDRKLMAVELAAQPRIVLLASIRTRADHYFSEPQAVVDPLFEHVLFNANWGSGRDTDIDAYLLTLPPGGPQASPR